MLPKIYSRKESEQKGIVFIFIIIFLYLPLAALIYFDLYRTYKAEKDIAESRLCTLMNKGLGVISNLECPITKAGEFNNQMDFVRNQLVQNKSIVHSVSHLKNGSITEYSVDGEGRFSVSFTGNLPSQFQSVNVRSNLLQFSIAEEHELYFVLLYKPLGAGNGIAIHFFVPYQRYVKLVASRGKWFALKHQGNDDNCIAGTKVFDINRSAFYTDFSIRVLLLFLGVVFPFWLWGGYYKRVLKDDLFRLEKYLEEDDDHAISGLKLIAEAKLIFQKQKVHTAELAEQLSECRERLSQFYQASVDAIVIHQNGVPLFFNPALEEITGFTRNALLKKTPFDFIDIDVDLLTEVREQRQPVAEAVLTRQNGEKLYVEIQVKSVTYRGRRAESIVIRDITHRKFMEQELQLQRMRQVKSVIDGQEKERQRLSRELHDGLGQNLVAIKLKLESIPASSDNGVNNTLAQVKGMFSHTIDEVRRISNNLMPAALKEFSLAVVLRNLCNEVEGNSGIKIELAVGVLPEPIDQLLKTYVYRIVQEALTNIIKHSGANRAAVNVYADFKYLHLQIEDNGVGFNTSATTDTGNGLYNMKERAVLLNGKISFISSKDKGTKIVALFPLKQQNIVRNG